MPNVWPWEPTPKKPVPTLAGDIAKFLEAGFWKDVAELEYGAALLCSGIPGDGVVTVVLERKGPELKFNVERDDCKFQKRIVIGGDGDIELHSDMYFLREDIRNTGLGKRMFRNSLIAYDDIGVGFVTARANYFNGGYTWAKLAARPYDPSGEREALLQRLHQIAFGAKFSKSDISALEKVLVESPDERLMHAVACSANAAGVLLGKALLVGHSWDAFWDLSDADHRSQIAEALRP